ncbi:MAG TPA: ZIP family metal transporter [Longimicrobiales bacterium]|nr:ZIP family metal transporter [Longimicrobiales bacterium]
MAQLILAGLYALLAGTANMIGGLIVLGPARRVPSALNLLVAFGAGFMLAVAVLEMLPDAVTTPAGAAMVLIGYLAVHLTQHTLTPHFHFGEETHREAMVSRGIGLWALVGLIPHSFFDGVAIAGGVLQSPELGLMIFSAVILHKVPTGVSLASVMLASGNSGQRTILAVALVGLATVLGAVITPAFDFLAIHGLGLATGVLIYVAASNLIPESQHQPGWTTPGSVFLGVLAFWLITLLLPGI